MDYYVIELLGDSEAYVHKTGSIKMFRFLKRYFVKIIPLGQIHVGLYIFVTFMSPSHNVKTCTAQISSYVLQLVFNTCLLARPAWDGTASI